MDASSAAGAAIEGEEGSCTQVVVLLRRRVVRFLLTTPGTAFLYVLCGLGRMFGELT